MDTPEQLSQMVIQNSKDIAALWESAKSAHKRLDENDRITNGIYKLAANMESLTANMENLTEQVKKLADRLEDGLREQGKRIGNVETSIIQLTNLESKVNSALAKIEAIEKEPATKWKNLGWLIIAGVVTAMVGFFMAKVL